MSDILRLIKNLVIVFIMAILIPALTHLYLNYFLPYPEYKTTEELLSLQKKIGDMENQKDLVTKSFEQGKASQEDVVKLQSEIKALSVEADLQREALSNNFSKAAERYSTHRFIISMIISLLFVCLGIFISYSLLRASFTIGGLFLALYGLGYNWTRIDNSLKLLSMTLWFAVLLVLVIYYHQKEE